MSKQNKRDGVLIRGQTLEDWDRLLDKESNRVQVLIKNYAREEMALWLMHRLIFCVTI